MIMQNGKTTVIDYRALIVEEMEITLTQFQVTQNSKNGDNLHPFVVYSYIILYSVHNALQPLVRTWFTLDGTDISTIEPREKPREMK